MQRVNVGIFPLAMVVILVGTAFVGMVDAMAPPTVDFSQTPTEPANWVFIAAALHYPDSYQTDPDYIEAMELYWYFKNLGYDDDHIILLVDFDTAPFIDGPASKSNIMASLDFLGMHSTPESFVFLGILDWGCPDAYGNYYIDLLGESLYDYELEPMVDTIAYDQMVIDLVYRHSGAWKDEMRDDDRIVLMSCKNNIDVDTHYSLAEGLMTPEADKNENGVISVEEAFKWTKNIVDDEWDDPKPVKTDKISGQCVIPMP